MKNCWTLDKQMASLSTCHPGHLPCMAILLKHLSMCDKPVDIDNHTCSVALTLLVLRIYVARYTVGTTHYYAV